MTNRRCAPWTDFKRLPIHEGDVMVHPSGEEGMVIYMPEMRNPWRVMYEGSIHTAALSLQVGDRGQAVVKKPSPRSFSVEIGEATLRVVKGINQEVILKNGEEININGIVINALVRNILIEVKSIVEKGS